MTKKEKFQTLTGMRDILPQEQAHWQNVYQRARTISTSYGFEKIDTPIVEDFELFNKGTGEITDIVQKEMFSLRTKGGTHAVLRPEGTPPIVRAYLEHGMEKWTTPVKLFYIGAMFRHERPQQGRLRQFHQFGVECIGENDPIRDVQVIQVFVALLSALKIKNIRLEVNTLGCKVCLVKYKKALKDYYTSHIRSVCADCRVRHKQNPLRLLDCKDEKCQRTKLQAPHVLDFVCNDCKSHFKHTIDYLDILDIGYTLNNHLVRGLDYYTRTVFEIFQGNVIDDKPQADDKRIALASGGRYDNLIESLGGKPTPAVGGALGIERIIACLGEYQTQQSVPVFVVQLGQKAKKKALFILQDLQKAKINVREAFGKESIGAQMKVAEKLGVKMVIIVGQKEVLDKVALIRNMDTGLQEIIPEARLLDEVKKRLKQK